MENHRRVNLDSSRRKSPRVTYVTNITEAGPAEWPARETIAAQPHPIFTTPRDSNPCQRVLAGQRASVNVRRNNGRIARHFYSTERARRAGIRARPEAGDRVLFTLRHANRRSRRRNAFNYARSARLCSG